MATRLLLVVSALLYCVASEVQVAIDNTTVSIRKISLPVYISENDVGRGEPVTCETEAWGSGYCTSFAECAIWSSSLKGAKDETCTTAQGVDGICCPSNNAFFSSDDDGIVVGVRSRNKTYSPMKLFDRVYRDVPIEEDLTSAIEAAVEEALEEQGKLKQLEQMLQDKHIVASAGSATSYHQSILKVSPEAAKIGRSAYTVALATRVIRNAHNLNYEQAAYGLTKYKVPILLQPACLPEPKCDEYAKYRTYDGSCNNPKYPNWGRAYTSYIRLLPALYADGIYEPRTKSKDGSLLHSPRWITTFSMVPQEDTPDFPNWTELVTLFGQWISHDLSLAPAYSSGDQNSWAKIECCTPNGDFIPFPFRHPACFPIEIPPNDPFYKTYYRRCMNFVRTTPGPREDCNFGCVEQMNGVSSYLDGSAIYGVDEKASRALRGPRGALKVTPSQYGEGQMLPIKPQGCNEDGNTKMCFETGESRNNLHPHLTIVHTLWVREHNRIAYILADLNPHWDDEYIFQETRRIIIAEIQHITYNEYLPVLIGPDAVYKYGMQTKLHGYSYDYSDKIRADISNQFAAAAYRCHTMIYNRIYRLDPNYRPVHLWWMRESFHQSEWLMPRSWFDEMLRGTVYFNSKMADAFIENDVWNLLFHNNKIGGSGLDLFALNIQRGRDHGLQPYYRYRILCGLKEAYKFEDLYDVMGHQEIEWLKRSYKYVEDIDLYVGILLERKIYGTAFGPTGLCIVGDQFARLKKGDYYFYDLGGYSHSFTPQQLQEIRKSSMAAVICDNSGVGKVQPLAFLSKSYKNPDVDCRDYYRIPRMNLAAWKQEYQAPAYQAPAYSAPAYQAPIYQAPAYPAPTYQAPTSPAPRFPASAPQSSMSQRY